MARATWHPYPPDQAFGHAAAHDEELLDQAIARLERGRHMPPRAGSKAQPPGGPRSIPTDIELFGWPASGADLPVTTNVALDAAARLRSEPD